MPIPGLRGQRGFGRGPGTHPAAETPERRCVPSGACDPDSVCASSGPRGSPEERQEPSPGEHEADPAGVPVLWAEQGRADGRQVETGPGGDPGEGHRRREREAVRAGRALTVVTDSNNSKLFF